MPHNPPPAPDWVMGDDGHWKPPPFAIGHGAPTPPPPGTPLPPPAGYGAPPPGAGPYPAGMPLVMAAPMARPARNPAVIVAIVLGGLGVVVVALAVVSILAVTFLGSTSEESFEAVDMDPDTPGVQSDGPAGTGPLVPVDPGGGTVGDAGSALDPAVFCPAPAEVADATGLPESETSTGGGPHSTGLDLNSVRAGAVACEFGSTVGVLAITGSDATTFIEDLRGSVGPFVVTDGGRDIPSVDVVGPSREPDGGSVQVVFEVGGEVYSVARNGQDMASLEPLVDAVRARVE